MEQVDIAIIGGGVAGCYAAWRLKQQRPDASIALFEGAGRLGGRLHTIVPEGMPNLRAEIGGMRFPSFHRFALGLIETLGLPTKEFKEGNANNLFYLRGHRLRAEDFFTAEKVPYFLRDSEKGVPPVLLLKRFLEAVFPQAAALSPAELDQLRRTLLKAEDPLEELGFAHQLMQVGSREALELIVDAGGYYSALGNSNASDMLFTLLCHRREKEVHFTTLCDGLQSLPEAMASRFVQSGGRLEMNTRLVGLQRPDEQGRLSLKVRTGDQETRDLSAAQVMLCMPRRGLELLLGDCFLFEHEQFVTDLQAVAPQAASKYFLCYREPWWAQLGLEAGRSDTDLPMRQCYYFGTEGDQPGADPLNRNSLLMAGYNDGRAATFWESFVTYPNRLLESRLQRPHAMPDTMIPNRAMVDEMQRQLAEVHGIHVPDPYQGYFVDYGADPHGGAWHSWQPHARSWEVMPRMRQPVAEAAVYICGEAYSLDQGWVEGALNTTEQVLQEKFGLPAAPFLPADHYLTR